MAIGVQAMSEEAQDTGTKSKRKFSLSSLQVDRKFLIIALFLMISIVAVVFATRDLFETDIDDWTVTQGRFEGRDGTMIGTLPAHNWAYHDSKVAYGEWQWQFRYGTQGSASVIFIGSEQDPDAYSHSTNGYKIEFDITKHVSLKRIDGLYNEIVLGSTYVTIETGDIYTIKVTRFINNTFQVSINDQHKFTTNDATYTTSEVFELDWVFSHTLNWVEVTDELTDNSWSDYFVGMPQSSSTNIFTQIALFAPFIALALVILFYAFRLLLSEGSWTKFVIPLVLAIIIGVGAALLFDYLRDVLSFSDPIPSGGTPSVTIDNTSSISPISTGPSNSTSDPGGTGGPGLLPPIPIKPVSIILLVVSAIFILLAVGFVMFDFIRKRDDEFHDQIVDRNVRWLPKASESDHRKRVIRAYHKTSYDLIDHGAESERSMTPGEFEHSAAEKLAVPEEPIEEITELYEKARFSDQEIDSKMSTKAEKHFDSISQDLRKAKKESKKEDETPPQNEKDDNQITEDK
ncbi:MAG: DUF4129 domain-containing protein [Candidatus Heimdallarchaeota archaeon]